VRIEIPNPGILLRLGMFVDVSLGGAARAASSGQPTAMVPRSAVQNIGSKQVVYLAAGQPGVFIQREVSAGPEADGRIPILTGVSDGDRIVTEGSFLLRAESLKLNPTQSTSSGAVHTQPAAVATQKETTKEQQDPKVQTAKILLTSEGYKPASVRLRKNVPARLSFLRTVEVTCGTEVVIPDYNIRRELPLNKAVVVEFTPDKAGEFSFACGMNMVRGKIIVK
jgi:hypothetical protein